MQITNPHGRAILRARITDAVGTGQVFAPIHWTGETAPSARIDALVTAACDPVSGQPESKASVVDLRRFKALWYGFAVARNPMDLTSDYWALTRTKQGYRAELAGQNVVADWEAEARRILGVNGASLSSLIDSKRGSARIVAHQNGTLLRALYVSPRPVAVMRDYLATLPGTCETDVLSGRSAAGVTNSGPVICSCFGVGTGTILEAAETRGLTSVAQIGEVLGAGTNCGSCRPEIADLLASLCRLEAAE